MSVIRKLGFIESLLDEEFFEVGGELQTRSILFELKQGNELTLDLLKKACTYWVKHLSILEAEIRRTPEGAFFVKMSPDEAFNFDKNVELVETENASDWEKLMEEKHSFDRNKGHLWKLKVFKIINNPSLDYNYVLVLTTQHSITDGRNGYDIGRRLVNIIGSVVSGQTCAEMNEGNVIESKFNVEQLINQRHKLDPNYAPVSKFDKKSRITQAFSDANADDVTRLKYFMLPADQTTKLIKKMKENSKQAKLTSVLTLICGLAYKRLFKRHNVTDIPTDTLPFSLAVNLRDRLGLDNATMGAFVTVYDQVINQKDYESLDLNTIWRLAEIETTALHKFMQSNDLLDFSLFVEKDLSSVLDPNVKEFDFLFRLSNYGIMKNTDVDVVKIKEHYVLTLKMFGRHLGNISMNQCTIDGKLCWSCIYNQKLQSNSFVTELLDEIKLIINQLIEN